MSKIKATRPSLQRQENDTNNRTKKKDCHQQTEPKRKKVRKKIYSIRFGINVQETSAKGYSVPGMGIELSSKVCKTSGISDICR